MRGVSARERGHHQLRETQRQCPHRGGGDGRATATSERDHPVDPTVRHQLRQQQRRGLGHRHHALTAIVTGRQGREIKATCRRHFLAGNVGRHGGWRARADVDQQHVMAAPTDQIRDKGVLLPF